MGKTAAEKYVSNSNHYSVDVRRSGGGNVLKAICGICMSKTQPQKF